MSGETTKITVQTSSGPVVCRHRVGDSLLQTLQHNGMHLPAPCGGTGKCGKCVVAVSDESAAGPRHPEEDRHAPAGSGTRLACLAVPKGPLTVTLPDSLHVTEIHSGQKGGTFEVPAEGIPIVRAVEITLPFPTLEDQRSVHQRLLDALNAISTPETRPDGLRVSLHALRNTTALLDAAARGADPQSAGGVELIAGGLILPDDSGERLAAVEPEVRERLPALAVDIGTTTIAAYLVDLASRSFLAIRSEHNLQSRFGADVVSRISAQSQGSDLTAVVRDQIAQMLSKMATEAGISASEVLAATVVGNPTMIHLFYGLDPASIGRAPFMPISSERLALPAKELDLPLGDDAPVISAPAVSAYVGADLIADILASDFDLRDEEGGVALLIDVGTNGEMVLKSGSRISACSTAAGPAFEGANIRCGSGGVPGAIDSVARTETGFEVTTIASEAARSICGSGLMDLVALLLDDGIIDETGLLDAEAAGAHAVYRDRLIDRDGETAIVVDDRGLVSLGQSDIRQVQLAKGAIAAGVRTLLAEASAEPGAATRVYLAGGFGTYVDPVSACRVGLLPGIPADRVSSIGNSAGAGAVRLLTDRGAADRARRLAASINYIELSSSLSFQQLFAEEMLFPAG